MSRAGAGTHVPAAPGALCMYHVPLPSLRGPRRSGWRLFSSPTLFPHFLLPDCVPVHWFPFYSFSIFYSFSTSTPLRGGGGRQASSCFCPETSLHILPWLLQPQGDPLSCAHEPPSQSLDADFFAWLLLSQLPIYSPGWCCLPVPFQPVNALTARIWGPFQSPS